MAEIEVYRNEPEEGKYYYTTTLTRRAGNFPNQRFYTTNELVYVGKFIKHYKYGYHDNAVHWDIFDKNGTEIKVNYTYEGTTCFLETTKQD
jgi:hypothetical protein